VEFYPPARARDSYPGVQNGADITIQRPETACVVPDAAEADLYKRRRIPPRRLEPRENWVRMPCARRKGMRCARSVDAARQPVNPRHRHDVAGGELAEHPVKLATVGPRARHLIAIDVPAAASGGAKLLKLAVEGLPLLLQRVDCHLSLTVFTRQHEKSNLIKAGWRFRCLRGTLTWIRRSGRIAVLI